MNNELFFSLHNLAHQNYLIDFFVIFCAKYLPYLAIVFVLFFILFKKTKEPFNWQEPFRQIKIKLNELGFVFSSIFISWIIANILKDIFKYPRPFIVFTDKINPLFLHGGMDSFPSGHATFFGALALSVYFINKKLGFVFFIIAILIGISRIISGVHFPIDILSGYLLGFIIVIIFRFILNNKKLK